MRDNVVDLLKEFVADVEAAYPELTDRTLAKVDQESRLSDAWFDLLITYRKAKGVLD